MLNMNMGISRNLGVRIVYVVLDLGPLESLYGRLPHVVFYANYSVPASVDGVRQISKLDEASSLKLA